MTRSRNAWSLLALAVAMSAGASIGLGTLAALALLVATAAVGSVGAILVIRVPDNPIGRLFLAFALVAGLAAVLDWYGDHALTTGAPGGLVATWAASTAWPILLGLAIIPPLLLFPTGRLRSRRWRPALWCAPAFTILAVLGNGLYPLPLDAADGISNPFALPAARTFLDLALAGAGLCLLGGVVAGIASLALHYRHGSVVERAQLKWFMAAAVVVAVGVGAADEVRAVAELQTLIISLAMIPVPVAIGIAITRHNLYEIDRVISRTVAYALVTGLLVAVYAGSVVTLRAMLSPIIAESDLAVVASTLLVAALFGPVRRRVQGVVDRRFNRARYDAAHAIEAFGQQLRDQVDLGQVAAQLAAVTSRTLAPTTVAVWLAPRPPDTP